MLRSLLVLLLAGPPAVAQSTAPRLNIVLVMTDDQGWGDVYAHGNSAIDTPVLDRLATEGARFDRFYVSPVCAPTRAALLTGGYPLRTGTADVTPGLETMRADELTLAEVFRDAGYATVPVSRPLTTPTRSPAPTACPGRRSTRKPGPSSTWARSN